jgi:hypothetical protein
MPTSTCSFGRPASASASSIRKVCFGSADAAALVEESRHLVERIKGEPFGLDGPAFADESVGREPLQGLETPTEVVGGDEVVQMHFKLLMTVVVVSFDRCFLDVRFIHLT